MHATPVVDSTYHHGQTRAESELVNLATSVLDVIMQIRAGLITPSFEMRREVDGLLKEMEHQAAQKNYPADQVQAAKFALAAFVDETVLTLNFAVRDEWEKYPLQLEYFGEQLAGVKFYERLEQFMKEAARFADVIEVYYLALLLGYKGKYKIYFEDQLKDFIESVADCLRRVNRLRTTALSPHWKVTDQPAPVVYEKKFPRWALITLVACLGGGLLLYLVFWLIIQFGLKDAASQLLTD